MKELIPFRVASLIGSVVFVAFYVNRLFNVDIEKTIIILFTSLILIFSMILFARTKRYLEIIHGIVIVITFIMLHNFLPEHVVTNLLVLAPIAVYFWKKLPNICSREEISALNDEDLRSMTRMASICFQIVIPLWIVSFFVFAFYLDFIPKVERGAGVRSTIITCFTLVIVYVILAILRKIAPKAKRYILWVYVVAAASFGIIPGIMGFGLLYSVIVGVPFGIMGYYVGRILEIQE